MLNRCFVERLALIGALFCQVACGAATAPLNAGPPLGDPVRVLPGTSGSTYKVTKGLLFVALPDPYKLYDDVQVYDVREANSAPIADIRDDVGEPESACVDHNHTLYVVNGLGWISEYAIGSTSAKLIINEGLSQPAFCAIDKAGNLWVTNVGGQNVTEFLAGSSIPNKVITQGLPYPLGIAFDHHGNMYIANRYSGKETNVQVFAPGANSPSRTITDGVHWPVGIGVDSKGTLYVTNLIPGNITEYHYGSSKPFRVITKGMDGPAAVTFSPSGWMYVSNYGSTQGGSGPRYVILEFAPQSRVPSKKMISRNLYTPAGTAFYPPPSL